MVGVTAILVGYLAGQLWPDTFNGTINSPTLMIGFCVVFAFGVAYIAYRGVTGTTGVNVAINVIQISRPADLLGHRHGLPREPSPKARSGYTLDPDGNADQRRAGHRQGRQADQGRKDRHSTRSSRRTGKDKPLMLDTRRNGH